MNIEDVATPQAFRRAPSRVHDFYNARRRQLLSDAITPNPAHLALSKLQQSCPAHITLVTQNIDDLHERAGSTNVIHMHGELLKARCISCEQTTAWTGDLSTYLACPHCGLSGVMRPDVVWFGEMPMHMELIYTRLRAG